MEGRDYLLALTDAGREQANDRMQLCRYIGPAPVSLEAYSRVIRAPARQAAHRPRGAARGVLRPRHERRPAARARPGRHRRRRHVPLRPAGHRQVVDRRAPAAGPRRLRARAPRGRGRRPDHHGVRPDRAPSPSPEQPDGLDPRWVLCERPVHHRRRRAAPEPCSTSPTSRGSGIYLAPLQMQANNGILVIDDFGRQTLTPEELLNRWIVPLDRQVDYLSLDYGLKFEIPFDAKIVFSTNLEPETLGDEAFFRRIQTQDPDPADRRRPVRRGAAPGGAQPRRDRRRRTPPTHLRRMSRELGDGDLRPYLPAAVCKILDPICAFEDLPLRARPDDGRAHRAHVLHPHRRPGRRDPRGGRGPAARRHPDRRPAPLHRARPTRPDRADPPRVGGGSPTGAHPRPCPRPRPPAGSGDPAVAAPAWTAAPLASAGRGGVARSDRRRGRGHDGAAVSQWPAPRGGPPRPRPHPDLTIS